MQLEQELDEAYDLIDELEFEVESVSVYFDKQENFAKFSSSSHHSIHLTNKHFCILDFVL